MAETPTPLRTYREALAVCDLRSIHGRLVLARLARAAGDLDSAAALENSDILVCREADRIVPALSLDAARAILAEFKATQGTAHDCVWWASVTTHLAQSLTLDSLPGPIWGEPGSTTLILQMEDLVFARHVCTAKTFRAWLLYVFQKATNLWREKDLRDSASRGERD